MANIVISRIQHRRGRRENLPQPLLPAEVALTSDTSQAWMGQDPSLAVPSINVYADKLEQTAQTIIDANVLETRFDENMTVTVFNTLVAELKVAGGVTLVDDDILWDDTYRGTIESLIITGGTVYVTGDVITAISATGSGFTGTITETGGVIDGVVITNGGTNYHAANTTFSIASAGGSGATITPLVVTDIYGSTVHIAANPTIDAGNTIANIGTTIDGLSSTITDRLMATTPHLAFGAASGNTFISSSLIVDNHTEAANVVAIINRVNSTTPGQNTGLAYTNLNIELTTDNDDITSFQLAVSDLITALTIGTSKAYFRMPRSMIVSEVRGSLLTASTSGAVTIDINKNGSTILSTKLTIDQDEKTSVTAAVPPVISDETLADDDEITVDIDVAGTGALGLIVALIGIA